MFNCRGARLPAGGLSRSDDICIHIQSFIYNFLHTYLETQQDIVSCTELFRCIAALLEPFFASKTKSRFHCNSLKIPPLVHVLKPSVSCEKFRSCVTRLFTSSGNFKPVSFLSDLIIRHPSQRFSGSRRTTHIGSYLE